MLIRTMQRVAIVAGMLLGLIVLAAPAAAKPDEKTSAVAAKSPASAAVPVAAAATQPCPVACPCFGNGTTQAAATLPPSALAPAVAAKAPTTRPTATAAPGMGMRGRGMGRGGPGNMREVMGVFHQLLTDHAQIQRDVKDLKNGVVTVTTSQNPVVTALIRTHVTQMKSRLEKAQPVRQWDPLFAEIFRHADKVDMKIDEVEGGVRVTETSQDPQVVLLIQQHARQGVSQFVARGWDRAHAATPLPEGYQAKPATPAKSDNAN